MKNRIIEIGSLAIFKPGMRVVYNNCFYTVHHTIVRGYDVYVYLKETGEVVHSNKLRIDLTQIDPMRINVAV
jgi:hypothetical protein